jgi:TatD DNase family protein
MFIDTHCHLNLLVKEKLNVPLSPNEIAHAQHIIDEANAYQVVKLITVGTSVIESQNCVTLARNYKDVYATVGIHPNDCTAGWKNDLLTLEELIKNKHKHKIVGIGECGFDFHYPDFNKQRQSDAFKAQIELALQYDLALVVHTRDARDETLQMLQEFKGELKRGVIHCFSDDFAFAQDVIKQGFHLGIGASITYPNNDALRLTIKKIGTPELVLETDAPFLPPQQIRGKKNKPKFIVSIATFLAELKGQTLDYVAQQTTENATLLFNLTEFEQ